MNSNDSQPSHSQQFRKRTSEHTSPCHLRQELLVSWWAATEPLVSFIGLLCCQTFTWMLHSCAHADSGGHQLSAFLLKPSPVTMSTLRGPSLSTSDSTVYLWIIFFFLGFKLCFLSSNQFHQLILGI